MMSEFSEQWKEEKMGTIPPQKTPSIVQTMMERIESLENRLEELKQNRIGRIQTIDI